MSGVLTHTAQKRLVREIKVHDVGRESAKLAHSYKRSKTNLYLLAVEVILKPSFEVGDTDVRVRNRFILDFGVQFTVVGHHFIFVVQFIGHHRPNRHRRYLLKNHARNDSILVDFDLTLFFVRRMCEVEPFNGEYSAVGVRRCVRKSFVVTVLFCRGFVDYLVAVEACICCRCCHSCISQ